MSEEDKQIFIDKINKIKNLLYVIDVKYEINNVKNYPTPEIIKMLDNKLQPCVGFLYSNKLHNYSKEKSNLIPTIPNDDGDIDCFFTIDKNKKMNYFGHSINLRRWTNSYVEFKNSWGIEKYYSGNFSVEDISQLSCVKNNDYTPIYFICLMFDKDKLPGDIKNKCNEIQSMYHPTIDIFSNYNLNYKIKKYYIEDGNIYNGDWLNDNKNGEGIMIYSNNDVYLGDWLNDKKNGIGIMYYANGDKYAGNWKDDKKNGNGKMEYINGDKYEGNWLDDKRSGNGKMIYANGHIYTGIWLNDNIQTGGLLDNKNLKKYKIIYNK
jgi:hypothetical protein